MRFVTVILIQRWLWFVTSNQVGLNPVQRTEFGSQNLPVSLDCLWQPKLVLPCQNWSYLSQAEILQVKTLGPWWLVAAIYLVLLDSCVVVLHEATCMQWKLHLAWSNSYIYWCRFRVPFTYYNYLYSQELFSGDFPLELGGSMRSLTTILSPAALQWYIRINTSVVAIDSVSIRWMQSMHNRKLHFITRRMQYTNFKEQQQR